MKNHPAICLLFCLLTASPAIGQTKFLVATSSMLFDSGLAFSGDSATFAYNSNFQINQLKYWTLDDTGIWSLKSRVIDYAYDASGNLIYYLLQIGNDVNGWTNLWRYTYTYHTDGQLLSFLGEKWNGSSWVKQSIDYDRVYDANGHLISLTANFNRSLYTYNGQGQLETQTHQKFSDGNWVDKSRQEFTYLPDNITITTAYNWLINAWIESDRYTSSYDINGNLLQDVHEEWNGTSWVNVFQILLVYVDGYPVENLSQRRNGTSWENFSKSSQSYDANHNLIYVISEEWIAGVWSPTHRLFNRYDAESNFLGARLEGWDGASWDILSYSRLHYSDFVPPMPALNGLEVFPNPASTFVTLKSQELNYAMIFDQQGRIVRSQKLQGQTQETLQLGNLFPGNYLLQVLGNDAKVTTKPLQIRR